MTADYNCVEKNVYVLQSTIKIYNKEILNFWHFRNEKEMNTYKAAIYVERQVNCLCITFSFDSMLYQIQFMFQNI